MNSLYLWLLGQLQRRCQHPDHLVAADILEGESIGSITSIQHCGVCGAVRIVRHGTWGRWREVRADWCIGEVHDQDPSR